LGNQKWLFYGTTGVKTIFWNRRLSNSEIDKTHSLYNFCRTFRSSDAKL